MAFPSGLVGKRVRIFIDEFDAQEPPELPPGTILRRLAGPDHGDYWLMRLDTPVVCQVWRAASRWTLHELVVAPHFAGDSLSNLFGSEKHDCVAVTIARVISPLEAEVDRFEFSQVDYFARGHVIRVG
jgi:hypothetical protein